MRRISAGWGSDIFCWTALFCHHQPAVLLCELPSWERRIKKKIHPCFSEAWVCIFCAADARLFDCRKQPGREIIIIPVWNQPLLCQTASLKCSYFMCLREKRWSMEKSCFWPVVSNGTKDVLIFDNRTHILNLLDNSFKFGRDTWFSKKKKGKEWTEWVLTLNLEVRQMIRHLSLLWSSRKGKVWNVMWQGRPRSFIWRRHLWFQKLL